jgi:subtilisin family serine protease
VDKSVPAVKADAVHNLFKVDCCDIAWAILDSGIDGRHEAFYGPDGESRIEASYDFRHFRKIVSLGNSRPGVRNKNAEIIRDTKGLLKRRPTLAETRRILKQIAQDARNEAPINWKLVERLIMINPKTPPLVPHGTHVAGILGAKAKAAKGTPAAEEDNLKSGYELGDGMCPNIKLYDFRVLAPDLRETEFAIIAALQFVRYLNERGPLKAIQGANLSLSIPHDVRNFACGRTPICEQCERLVESGVVVVAAAGNHGYKHFQTAEGPYAGYAAFSITDPGNAESVITVGATHRYWPHTYGVSFFSSRGPTGDGRVKPDLVAPGERIRGPLVGSNDGKGTWGDLDGTSMSAPHVSGAAAMLMARYTELIDQPRRIKQILCESATDLGRERTFQGSGMLDVLRAFQSV